jgi:hypothetical protein
VGTVAKWLRARPDGTDWRLTANVPMTLRSFTDSRGVSWRVRAMAPGIVSQLLPVGLRVGWIAFVSANERRRLAPIPDDWLTASSSVLEGYCKSATRVPMRGLWTETRH